MDESAVTFPHVFDEEETIAKVLRGYSLARFGDGELKMAHGEGYRRQVGSPQLAEELSQILRKPHKHCLVGIPTMDPAGPKYPNWSRHQDRFLRVLNPAMQYYSAFVSRPDSAPWIETREFAEAVQRIWAGKRTVVLCEKGGSMFRVVRRAARPTVHIRCPTHQAYDQIDEFERMLLAESPDVAVLSCGPTATCLANRLSRHGVQAIDLGSAGQFLLRNLR